MSKSKQTMKQRIERLTNEPSRCIDCGETDMLDSAGACPSCHTERLLDMAEHYAEEK